MIIRNKRIMKEGKCSVCGYPVMADEGGNGEECQNCGWRQDAAAKKLPDNVLIANPISLNKANQLYKEGKPFEPDFDDFIEFCEMYGEVEFVYNKIIYGIARAENDGFQFWACDVPIKERTPIVYANIDEFADNANIDGILIKDLWHKIKNFDCLN